jgi:cytochrome c oxidase cbb3-type subunit 3
MSRLMALGVALGLVAMIGCGGGEGQQQAGAGEAAGEAAAESQAMAEQQMELPEGITTEMVSQGREIYAGAGLCYTCHGAGGEGVPGLGANLMDDEWLHSDGSYDGIVGTVMDGVDTSASSTGTPMPEKGGSGITDDQVKAVAAYVLTLGG